MPDWPLRWSDRFDGPDPDPARWVGGHFNSSTEASIGLNAGIDIRFTEGRDYASVALVSREAIVGDFDARVRFVCDKPQQGCTLELAAIGIDGPRDSALDQAQIPLDDKKAGYLRSRTYNVHGAPPYVSSEFDEDDGARVAWNRGPAIELVVQRPGGSGFDVITDNHYNRYGNSTWNTKPVPSPSQGWLRLVRDGRDWRCYHRVGEAPEWRPSGQVLAMNLPDGVFLRLASKHWVKGGKPAPANRVWLGDFELRQPQA